MYLKMYIKSERFYQQPDNQSLKDEDKYFSDYDEELDDRKFCMMLHIWSLKWE